MLKRILLISSIAICLVVTNSACMFSKNNSTNAQKSGTLWTKADKEPVRGGSLKLFSSFPDTLNPLLSENIFIKDYSALMYDSMYVILPNQEVKPSLIEKSEVSSDGLVWTFKLRGNIFWHDGVPFSAEDIEFTFNTILSQSNNSIYKNNLRSVVSFSTIDKNSFRLVLQKGDGFLPWRLTFPILPKHYYGADVNFDKDKLKPPDGTGPFKFVEFKQNEYIKLKANEQWWGVKNGAKVRTPYIEEIEIKLGQDAKAAAELFASSNLDVVLLKRGFWDNYVGRRDVILQKYPSNEFEFLAYNFGGNSWLDDKNIRKAINFCIDRVELINSVIPGEATPADIPLFPESLFNDGGISSFSSSREKSKEILMADGWKYDGNGKLYKEINGFPSYLRLSLAVNTANQTRESIANEIKRQLESIGMIIDIKAYEDNDEYSRILSKKAFELAIAGVRISGYPDLVSLYTNENMEVNITGYNNLELNNLSADFASESDYAKKKVILKNIRAILDEEVPYSGLYFYNNAVLYSKKFKGNFDPHSWNKLNDVSTWFLNY